MNAEKIINEIKNMEEYIKYLQAWRDNLQEEVEFLRNQCRKNNIPYKRTAKKLTAVNKMKGVI